MNNHNKLAVAHCVHHKPWLITSSVLSTHAQSHKDFHTFFLINEGHERDLSDGKFRDDYAKFISIRDKNNKFAKSQDFHTSIKGKNTQLDYFDKGVKEFCNLNVQSSTVSFENDHGLDSGAWLKFIRSGKWKSYDSILFLGEGSLLARSSSLNDMISALENKDVNFITGSQDKRFLSRDRWTTGFASEKIKGPMPEFHDEMIKKTYEIFLRDPDFQKVYEEWPIGLPTAVDNLVPKVWGPRSRLIRFINSDKAYKFLNFIIPSTEEVSSKILRNQELINADAIKKLKIGNMNLYKEEHIGWYGACCNHLISREALEKLSKKFEKYSIYDVLDLPYAATALEQIWGLMPYWIGEDVWFTDAIHRVRKNFFTYQREDNAEVLERYLNRYYNNVMTVKSHENDIFLDKIHDDNNKLKNLPSRYKL